MSASLAFPAPTPQDQLMQTIGECGELLRHSHGMLAELRNEANSVGRSTAHFPSIHNELKEVERKLERLDCAQTVSKTAIRLDRQLRKLLPKWLSKYMFKIARSGAAAAYESPVLDVYRMRINSRLNRAIAEQAQARMSMRLSSAGVGQLSLSSQPQRKALTVPKDSGKQISFPVADFQRTPLHGTWQQLRAAWLQASSGATQPEDHYRLEQIATSALPESLRMRKALDGAAPEAKAEAEQLLAEQLSIMLAQVQQIVQRHSQDALIALRAQTAFVRGTAKEESVLMLPERAG